MPRALRNQYAGAVYHLKARGDGGKEIFEDDQDRKGFLFRLGMNRGHGLQIDRGHGLHFRLGGCPGKKCHQWNKNNNL